MAQDGAAAAGAAAAGAANTSLWAYTWLASSFSLVSQKSVLSKLASSYSLVITMAATGQTSSQSPQKRQRARSRSKVTG